MRHMLGDYHSNISPMPAFIIAAILIGILLIVIAAQSRRAEVRRIRELNTSPTRLRSTYQAAQNMAVQAKQEADNAIFSTHP
jgi:outer membrane biosynthesis protein TonB